MTAFLNPDSWSGFTKSFLIIPLTTRRPPGVCSQPPSSLVQAERAFSLLSEADPPITAAPSPPASKGMAPSFHLPSPEVLTSAWLFCSQDRDNEGLSELYKETNQPNNTYNTAPPPPPNFFSLSLGSYLDFGPISHISFKTKLLKTCLHSFSHTFNIHLLPNPLTGDSFSHSSETVLSFSRTPKPSA